MLTLNRIRTFILQHRIITAAIILLAAVGGYYTYRYTTQKSADTVYTLGTIERGTLISTVSGSGQVSASDQLDIKAKVSGTVMLAPLAPGTQVKAGNMLLKIDAASARKTVRDAETALASAKLSLEKLTTPPDALSVVQAENSLNAAQRTEVQAEDAFTQLIASSAQTVTAANDDGYNASAQAFLDMPNEMKDLKDLRGTDVDPDTNIATFKHILGENSPLITIWIRDNDAATRTFNTNFDFFKSVPRTADDATRYQLISRSLETEIVVAQALQSAHAMLDAVVNTTYKNYSIATTVDLLRTKIGTDISQVNGDIVKTRSSKDTIDTTTRNLPIQRKKAQSDITAAKETVNERTDSLAKLKAGPDQLDVRMQQLSVQQRADALTDAQNIFSDHTITVPFDGFVATYPLKKGDQISSGGAVATLVTTMRFADVTLNEVDAVKAKAGDKVTLTFDAISGLSITGKVADVAILGTVSQGVVTYVVRIQFDTQDERIRPGMSVSAAIVYDAKPDVLLIQSSAVKSSQGGAAHYVLMFDAVQSAGKKTITAAVLPQEQPVEIGASNDSKTEIMSGLEEGDIVVIKSAAVAKVATTGATTTQPRSGGLSIPGLGGGGVRVPGGGGFRGD